MRDAIAQSASAPAGQSTLINFQSGLSGTILLDSQLSIRDGQTVTIQGPGAATIAVSGQHNVQVLVVCSGTVNLSGLTIENGGYPNNGAIEANAAGIANYGTLTVTDSTFSGNNATGPASDGGGIQNVGTLTVTNSTFSGNSAGTGGGIENAEILAVTNSTFFNNSAAQNGGGIHDVGSASATAKSNILASNSGGNCSVGISSQGYNLSDDDTCLFSGTGDLNNTPRGSIQTVCRTTAGRRRRLRCSAAAGRWTRFPSPAAPTPTEIRSPPTSGA